jgi:hypothetical protein
LYTLVLLASAASAEVYRWEDANGLHFTDDVSSMPERHREKSFALVNPQSRHTDSNSRGGLYPQNRLVAEQEARTAALQANLDQRRRAAEAKKQRQLNSRDLDSTLQSLVKVVVIWLLLAVCLLVVWIATLVDIVRSTFTTPSGKAVWMLAVLFLPLFGMVFYLILGANRKCDPVYRRERNPFGAACPVRSG